MKMKASRILAGVLVCGAMCAAHGGTWTWTGAQDGYWTNAANWTVNGTVATRCPGICSNEIFAVDGTTNVGWTAAVSLTDLAEFGTPAAGGATTINLDGYYCVSSITFKAGCPVYTLGTHSNQVIALESFGASATKSGRFTIESGASVPTLVAGFSVGMGYRPLQRYVSGSVYYGYIDIYNNTTDELVFSTFGHSRDPGVKVNANGTYVSGGGVAGYNVGFRGTGGYRFNGPCRGVHQYASSLWPFPTLYLYTAGKVRFSTPLFGRGIKPNGTYDDNKNRGPVNLYIGSSCKEVIIDEGCRVALSDWNYPTLCFVNSAKITGKGTLQLCVQNGKGITGNHGRVCVANGCVGTVETAMEFYDQQSATAPTKIKFSGSYNSGTFEVLGPTNTARSAIWFFDPMTFRADKITGFGIATATDTAVYFRNSGTIDYAGAGGETFSRKFLFVAANRTGTVANTGTGALTLSSTFMPTNGATYAGSSIVLRPDKAPILFTGSITTYDATKPFPLIKQGADTLVIAQEADLSGAGSLRISGGTVDLSGRVSGGALDFALPITYDTGDSALILPGNATLSLTSLAATAGQTAGKLDIVTSGRVSVQGMTAADPVPAGLTVNSCAVRFTNDGTLEPYYDVAIAAHGDMVPDGAANVVAIMTEGSGGADTIALASTSVKGLLHFCGVDAEIAIGSGRTLAAETITLARSSGNLNVGSANDAGTLAGGSSGTLTLKNTDPESVLSVNANIAAGTDVRVDGNTGPIQLAGGAAAHPSIHISDGELRLTGESPFYLGETFVGTNSSKALTATLKIDGAKNVVIGEDPLNVGSCLKRAWPQSSVGRLIVTNSVICNSDPTFSDESSATTNRAICVGLRWYGEMEIHAGAVITNRLIVGAVYDIWTEAAGAVRQYGGEMAAIGGKAANRLNSMIGSSYGNGYYELNGGKFSMLGTFALGYYGAGSFVQYGGHSVFTDHPLSTETTRCGPLAMGNGGSATMRFVGGTSEIHNKLTLTGGETNHGRSRLTVEDTAFVDAGTNAVKITGTTTAAGTWTNTADLVVCNGGTLRSSGFYCGYSASSKPGFRQVYTVGFNDGTLKLSASDGDICYRLTTSGATRAMTNTVIYAGGMTLDTDGKTGNYAGSPFKGAWGGGVVSVPCSPITKIIAAPIVDIRGDGFGATAVAEFDSKTGTMTGVKVVAPGVGYTKATALIYKTRDSYTTVDCVIAPNENTGSFTKKGDGDFSLNATNTWGGQTILEGGTLRLGVTGALPAGSTVVYNGGALAVADGVTLDSLTASLPKISPDTRYTLATFEGAAPGTAPAVTIEGVSDPRWQARIGGHKLLLSYTRGTVLVFR